METERTSSGTGRQSVAIACLSVTVLGLVCVVLSRVAPDGFWADLALGLGLALVPTGVLVLIGDYLIFGRAMESLSTNNAALTQQVEALRMSTAFLKQSTALGLEMVYQNRQQALSDFVPFMKEQAEVKGANGSIIIVGSSMLGLKEMVVGIKDILAKALASECKIKILLTHPKHSKFREIQEERPVGAIEDEIFEGIRFLEDVWEEAGSPTHASIGSCVKLYKGTPTCFMIIAGDHMLINPYPYEKEAYKSFCLNVRKHDDSGLQAYTGVFHQYYVNHFELPWKRNSLSFHHFPLKGPIPDEAWDKAKQYGDGFVIQDAGEFYLAVHLTGARTTEHKGIPTCVRYSRGRGATYQNVIALEETFAVRLLRVSADENVAEWDDLHEKSFAFPKLRLNPERRTGKLSGTVPGNFFNQYQMVGLYQSTDNPFRHGPAARPALRDKPLPMFYYWIEGADETPEFPDDLFGDRPEASAADLPYAAGALGAPKIAPVQEPQSEEKP